MKLDFAQNEASFWLEGSYQPQIPKIIPTNQIFMKNSKIHFKQLK